ncbi:MAG: hypothetical protein R2769_02815 [Saprospiraceae bacterium]
MNTCLIIVTIWLLGLLFFTLKLFGGLAYISYLRKRHVAPVTAHWQAKMQEISEIIGLKKSVQIFESALVEVPMVLGYLKLRYFDAGRSFQ